MSILLPGKNIPSSPPKFPIYARSGWEIPQENPAARSLQEMEIKANELKRWRPGITIRSLSVYPYNCVGMIFASRRAWIEIGYIYDILREDGYTSIEKNEVISGDVIVYKRNNEPVHVGLIIHTARPHPASSVLDILMLSKWGYEAEMIHYFDDVPVHLGTPTEFYTERPLR